MFIDLPYVDRGEGYFYISHVKYDNIIENIKYQFRSAGDTIFLLVFDDPTPYRYSQTDPTTFILFDPIMYIFQDMRIRRSARFTFL